MNEHHYLRMDAGQKRERYEKAARLTNERSEETGQMLPAVSLEERSEIVSQAIKDHADGKSLREIAADIGCSYEGLRIWMLKEQPEQYKRAQELGLIARIVYEDRELDQAVTPLDIARARESARFARWDAERRLPHLFGQKQEISHTIQVVDLDKALAAQASVILEKLQHTCVMSNTLPNVIKDLPAIEGQSVQVDEGGGMVPDSKTGSP